MFSASALRGFQTSLTVNILGMTADQASKAMAAAGAAERDRVLSEQTQRSSIAPLYQQIVNGQVNAPLSSVRPDGMIIFLFQYLPEIVHDTVFALAERSPMDTVRYIRSQIILVDGVEADLSVININTRQVHIVASAPYSMRLEVGKRRNGKPFVTEVPPHIVQETANVARRLYGALAMIDYERVMVSGATGKRRAAQSPAISIRPRMA